MIAVQMMLVYFDRLSSGFAYLFAEPTGVQPFLMDSKRKWLRRLVRDPARRRAHTQGGNSVPDLSHIMPNPRVVPILWGHDYVLNPTTANLIEQLVSDLVTGPFMNGLAQYGIRRGSVAPAIIIDDVNPPKVIVYRNSLNQFEDQITQKLISWINAGLVPAPASNLDINLLYLIIPPSETTPETYNGANDPIGNGVQAWHNEGVTNPTPPPTYYWAIVKTNDGGPPSSGFTFVNNFAQKVAHELAEQFVDRNGTFEEVGDQCLNNPETYRGWSIQQIWSTWDNKCINCDQPPPMPTSFQTVDGYNNIFVLGTNGTLLLETAPFGNLPPKATPLDATVFTFQAFDNQNAYVLGTDGNLWLETAPWGLLPPKRVQVDSDVQAFQLLASQSIVVLGNDANLSIETAPFGHVPPTRWHIDGNVRSFHAVNENYVFVLGTDGNLWIEEGPFGFGDPLGNVPPFNRQPVDGDVRSFKALGVYSVVWVLGTDGNLWIEFGPFGTVPPPNRQHIDANVLDFQPLDLNDIVVLRSDGSLWLETAPFGNAPPTRQQIDGDVMEFSATDNANILVLGTNGRLWWEQAPFGKVPPARHLVDEAVA
jgi:hypothetical protein